MTRPTPQAIDSFESIASAALNIGKVIISAPPPARHHNLLHAFSAYNRKTRISPSQQGFLTNKGRFVGRAEAMKIAFAAHQISEAKFQPGELFSEDLW